MLNNLRSRSSMTENGSTKVVHINLRKSRVAVAQLVQYAVESNVGILLVQDPYVKDGRIVGFPTGWSLFPSGALTSAIIVTHSKLQCVEAYRSENAVFVNISEISFVLTIGTQYSVPSGDLRADLESWGDVLTLNFDNLVISGDFNARDPAWGYSRPDARGRILSDFLQARRLIICNVVDSLPSYFTPAGLGTWPDVTFASSALLVRDWDVEDVITASDHRYVSFKLGGILARSKSSRFKTKTENLRKFEAKLLGIKKNFEDLFVHCDTVRDLRIDLDNFYAILIRVAASSFRRIHYKELRSISW